MSEKLGQRSGRGGLYRPLPRHTCTTTFHFGEKGGLIVDHATTDGETVYGIGKGRYEVAEINSG
jgi:hypothetical protein